MIERPGVSTRKVAGLNPVSFTRMKKVALVLFAAFATMGPNCGSTSDECLDDAGYYSNKCHVFEWVKGENNDD